MAETIGRDGALPAGLSEDPAAAFGARGGVSGIRDLKAGAFGPTNKEVEMGSEPTQTLKADVVIAGSGPGGATVARDLSRKGKKVILCEAGKYHRWFGHTLSTVRMLERMGLTFSTEGTWVFAAKTAGGGSVIFGGLAFKPPLGLREKWGVDLREEVEQVFREVPIRPLPDSHIGPGARKIMEAARDLGLDWKPNDRFIRPDKCKPDCAGCMLGCKEGAKWTAREYVEEALQNGAKLLLQTKVDRVLVESGAAVGVRAKGPGGWLDVLAETVVVSAGGLGTPPILQRSGLHQAGDALVVDPGLLVLGPSNSQAPRYEVPAACGAELAEEGILLVDAVPTPLLYALLLSFSGARGWLSMPKVLRTRRSLGILVMTRDRMIGRVNPDKSFSKPIDPESRGKLDKGAALAEEILQKAGVKRGDVVKTGVWSAHPASTVRVGGLLDRNCQTPIKGCYCMDASVLPGEWGLPPMVTIVAMAKRLSKHLTAPIEARATLRTP